MSKTTYPPRKVIAVDITHLFDSIHSKPGIVVDDQGWLWIKFVKVIKSVGNIGV